MHNTIQKKITLYSLLITLQLILRECLPWCLSTFCIHGNLWLQLTDEQRSTTHRGWWLHLRERDASEATATHAVTSPIVSNCEQLLCWIRWVLRILEELIFSLLCSSQCNRYRHDTLLICVTDIFSITFLRQVQQNNKLSHAVRCLKFP